MATGLESLLSGNLGVGYARGSDVFSGYVKPAYAAESGLDYNAVKTPAGVNYDVNTNTIIPGPINSSTTPATTVTSTPSNTTLTNNNSNSVIDQYYSDVENALNSASSRALSGREAAYGTAESQYGANVAAQQANRASSLATINEASRSAQDTKESAAAAARRLYSELQSGYRQRFGGSSSAGEAAYTLSGLEQQRSQSAIAKDYATAVRQIDAQKTSLEQAHNAALLQLKSNFDSAKNSILQQYNSTISQIDSDRTTAASAKASAKLDALQNLKSSVSNLNSSAANYESALTNAYNNQSATLQDATTKLTSYATGANTTATNLAGSNVMTANPTSSLQNITDNTTTTATPTGYSSSLSNKDKWNYGMF